MKHEWYEERALLPDLRIGACEWKEVNGYVIDSRGPGDAEAVFLSNTPILSNELFQQTVLTIDYRRQELLVRDLAFDFSQQPLRQGAFVLPFDWSKYESAGNGKVLVLQGRINEHPARLVLDTGWIMDEVGLTEAYYDAARFSHDGGFITGKTTIVTRRLIGGNAEMPLIGPVSLSLGSGLDPDPQQAVVVWPGRTLKVDGFVGYSVLSRFRITIDYPRRRVLFEPYASVPPPKAHPGQATQLIVNGHHYLVPNGSDVTVETNGEVRIKPPSPR